MFINIYNVVYLYAMDWTLSDLYSYSYKGTVPLLNL